MRADIYISKVKNISRSRAEDLIRRDLVRIDGVEHLEKDTKIYGSPEVYIIDSIHETKVGRGYEKIKFAAEHFHISFTDKTCLDIGSSTGGFTQCMHEHGAKLVVAVDIGINQMHPALKQKAGQKAEAQGIEIYEGQDIRTFQTNHQFDYIVCDISFISLKHILGDVQRLSALPGLEDDKTKWLLLFKPQFEVGKEYNTTGIVTDQTAIELALMHTIDEIRKMRPDSHIEYVTSHITGGDGNTEYWIYV